MNPTLTLTESDFVTIYGDAFVDVIHLYRDTNDAVRGMAGYACEFAWHRSAWRTSETLVEFAQRHFGRGRLRRIGNDADGERYVVLRDVAPVIRRNTVPSYAYHVA